MSPIGRIFIVLNLILAAGFLAAASTLVAEGESWKVKHDTAVAEATAKQAELDEQVSALRVENDTTSAEAATSRDERDDEKAKSDRLEGQIASLERQLNDQKTVNETNSSSISAIQGTLADVTSSKNQAIASRDKAVEQRNAANAKAEAANSKSEKLTTENAELNRTITGLNDKLAMAAKTNSSLETQIATLVDVTGVSLDEIRATKLINASVLQAVYDVKPGLVALNVGAADGVQRGYTFEIHNGLAYKGQVRVENVHDGMCTAIILRVEDGQTIASGDKASTRL